MLHIQTAIIYFAAFLFDLFHIIAGAAEAIFQKKFTEEII
jgi:hypothetical protein